MKRCLFALIVLEQLLWGDAGVMLPGDKKQPDPAILSLEEMSIDVHIDNGHARTSIRQIYVSHEGKILEGTYLFALPGRAPPDPPGPWSPRFDPPAND